VHDNEGELAMDSPTLLGPGIVYHIPVTAHAVRLFCQIHIPKAQ
jgi:hypothetical protein